MNVTIVVNLCGPEIFPHMLLYVNFMVWFTKESDLRIMNEFSYTFGT